MIKKTLLLVSAILLSSSTAIAASLDLSLLQITDISGLGFSSVGGAAYDSSDGRLWLSDASNVTNDLVELDPLTGTVFTRFDASVVPGLSAGPDAIALNPTTGNLFLFSTFTEVAHGEVTQAGALVRDLGGTFADDAGGATFSPDGKLLILDEDDGTIKEVDQITGAIISSTPLTSNAGRVGAADFDPLTGNLFAYNTNTIELLELDYLTGVVLSVTSLAPFLSSPNFASGFAFNGDGSQLYIASGTTGAGQELVVLNREVPEPATLSLLGLGAIGLLGRKRRKA